MEIYILILTLLFGSNNNCQYGDLTLFEDMSYRLVENDNTYTCNIGMQGSYFEWSEIRIDGDIVSVKTGHYTPGQRFPETVLYNTVQYNIIGITEGIVNE